MASPDSFEMLGARLGVETYGLEVFDEKYKKASSKTRGASDRCTVRRVARQQLEGHNLGMETWLNSKIEVRRSPIEGNGLFAREPIGAGEQLSRRGDDHYTIMSDSEFGVYIKTVDSWDAVAIGHGLHRVSLVQRQDELENYCNHSCTPNAESTGDGLVALRNMNKDEEITVDYARLSAASWSMTCNCGADNCSGIVRGTV